MRGKRISSLVFIFEFFFLSLIGNLSLLELGHSFESWEMDKIYRPQSIILKKNSADLTLQSSFFKTTKHFNEEGKEVPLANQESYRRNDYDLNLEYGFAKRSSFFTGATYQDVKSHDEGGKSYSNGGLAFLSLGFYLSPFDFSEIDFVLKSSYQRALFHNYFVTDQDYQTTTIALGDDREIYQLGTIWGSEIGRQKYLSMELSFIRKNDFSDEIFYRLETLFWGDYLGIIPGIEGGISLSNDPYGGRQQERPSIKRGSTYSVNSANKSFTAPFIEFSSKLGDGFKLHGGFKTILRGNNSDGGYELFLGLTMTMASDHHSYQTHLTKPDDKMRSNSKNLIAIQAWSYNKKFLKMGSGYLDGINLHEEVLVIKRKITGEEQVIGSGIILAVERDWAKVKVDYIDQTITLDQLDDLLIKRKEI